MRSLFEWLLGRRRPEVPPPAGNYWVVVPLGNPGPDYAETRHNLGRRVLQRWMAHRQTAARPVKNFATGTLYELGPGLFALVPATWMNLSGQVCGEAVAWGLDPARLVVLYDDKDLPLGLGRFRLDGRAGGHNGVQSVADHLGTETFARLRLGIGPFQRPLHEFVLQHWTEEELVRLESLDVPFARFLDLLAASEDLSGLGGRVNGADFWQG